MVILAVALMFALAVAQRAVSSQRSEVRVPVRVDNRRRRVRR